MSKGLVKAIGISNFTITKTENLLKTAEIVPAVNQVECHPYFQQEKLKHYCDKRGNLLFPRGHVHVQGVKYSIMSSSLQKMARCGYLGIFIES